MEPIEFAEANKLWAEDQPEYLPLHTWSDERETISLWHVSWWERIYIFITGRIWLRQLNFDQPLQPQRPEVRNPFVTH